MLRKIKLIIVICLALTSVEAQNINVSGNISTNTIWDAASIDTVKIIGNTTIDSTVVLTVEPGIVIDFTNDYFFNVKGRLIAAGTINDSITFTTSDTTGFSTNTHHGWSGIRIHDRKYSSDTIVLDYCIIEYGKADGSSGLENSNDGGGLYTYSNFELKLGHSIFRNNYAAGKGGAMYDYYSFVNQNDSFYDIIGCRFVNNVSDGDGGAIYSGRSYPNIRECVFEKNTSLTSGGAIRDGGPSSNISIYKSRFSYNKAGTAGAIYFSVASTLKHTIKQSIFNNNKSINNSGGALLLSQVKIDFQNNLLVNNESFSSGGALYIINVFSSVVNTGSMFANNTIAHNKALKGGGIYMFDNTNPGYDLFFNKNIFFNNETTTVGENEDISLGASPSNSNNPRFYSCSFTNDLNNTGIWDGYIYTNGVLLNTNPSFKIPSTGIGANFEGYVGRDWSLDCSSPCIDPTGATTFYVPDSLDYRDTPRMLNDTIDIGAYEAYNFLSQPQNLTICEGDTAVFSSTFYYPNVDLSGAWWSFSPDNGVNWYADQNYSGDYILSANTPASYNGYLVNLQVNLGCGMVFSNTATLTVHPKEFTQNMVSACDTYLIEGAWQTASGTYYDTLQTSFGCEKVIETILTINSSFYSSTTIDICDGDSALILGNYENTTNLYYDSLQTIYGCDSVYHVTLIVHPTYVINQNETICSNDSIYLQGAWQNTMNFYYDTLQTASSCDSIIITFLDVNPTSNGIIDTAFCTGTSVSVNGSIYNQSGVFTQNFTNIYGCDSLLTINVTENALPNANIGPDTLLVCDGELLAFGIDTIGIASYSISNFTITSFDDSLTFVYDALNAPSSVVSQVTDVNGCVNNDQVILQNNAIQYLQIGVPTFNDPSLTFTIANMPDNVDSWYWSFGDGTTLTTGDVNPTHEYTANGNYEACLIGTNTCGVDSSCITFPISTVGIDKLDLTGIKTYPNPVKNQLTITTNNLKIERVEILDGTGKIVQKNNTNFTTIDVSTLRNGIYFVKIYTDKGVGNKRIIKN